MYLPITEGLAGAISKQVDELSQAHESLYLEHLLRHPLDAAFNVGSGLVQELILDINQGNFVTSLGCNLPEKSVFLSLL